MAQSVIQIGGGHDSGGDIPVNCYTGSPLSAGDLVALITLGAGAESAVVSDNISGAWSATGALSGSQLWTRVMAGGETTIDADWGSGHEIDRVAAGYIIRAPRYPAISIVDQGEMIWDGSHMLFTSDVSALQDDATVIALSMTGSTSFGDVHIVLPPGNSQGGGADEESVGVYANVQDDPSALHAGQTLTLSATPHTTGEMFAAWLINGVEPGALEGTGRFIGGSGTLIVDVVNEVLEGDGQFLGGRGLLSARSPFPQPIRVPEDHLGCGIYQAFAMTRGLGEIVTMLPFTDLSWNRVLDETSEATLTIDGVANPRAIARCCAALSELDPEEHELSIIRNGWRVWSGPITDMTFPAEQCVIQASDLSWWLQNRTIHENINSVQIDLVNIILAYVQDAMAVDNSAGLIATVLALSGQLGDRLVQQKDHQMAADVIAELARSGVDWTQLDRRMLLGPLQPQPAPYPGATPYPTLIDANFRVQPTILVSGSQGANCWYVNGPPNGAGDLIFGEYGPEFPATPDHIAQPAAPDYAAIEAQYGRIEKVANESRILDQAGIDFNAQTRYDLLKRPLVYISDGALLPSTPIPIDKLLPGSIVNVHLSNVCRVIGEPYRIKQVAVSARADGSESVDVQWQPLGTGETL